MLELSNCTLFTLGIHLNRITLSSEILSQITELITLSQTVSPATLCRNLILSHDNTFSGKKKKKKKDVRLLKAITASNHGV